MDSNSNIEQKNRKRRLRLVLGVLISLLFVLSVDMILWAIGSLNTTMSVIIAILVNLLFVLSVGVILWNRGIHDGREGDKKYYKLLIFTLVYIAPYLWLLFDILHGVYSRLLLEAIFVFPCLILLTLTWCFELKCIKEDSSEKWI